MSPSKVASEKMNKVCFLCVTVHEIYKDYSEGSNCFQDKRFP